MAGDDHVLGKGARAVTARTRRVPTDTQVPVVSLKSSATRPLKAMPFSGRAGSIKRPASPIL
jgi:hypothetical protein